MISQVDTFIAKFNSENNRFSLSRWMHDHPTAIKVIQVTGAIFGLLALTTIPLTLPLLGIAVTAVIGTLGGISLLNSVISWVFVHFITCKQQNITQHRFEEKSLPGGRLYYRGNVPILELDDTNPVAAGRAHGELLGPQIHKLLKNFELIIYSIMRQPRARAIPTLLTKLRNKLPEHLKKEMKGIAQGYNNWARNAGKSHRLYLNDLLLLHLIADSKHFHTRQMEQQLTRQPISPVRTAPATVACTSILYSDPNDGMVFGRNMDWCPFGDGGGDSLVMVWKTRGVAVLGTPGLIGAITGWNRENLSLAMNVCPGETNSLRGLPAALFNRLVLENNHSVKEVREYIKTHRPLGPYHLTVADRLGQGACISFYQGANEEDYIRRPKPKKPLLVLNWRYPECQGGSFNSEGRNKLLNNYFAQAAKNISADQQEGKKLIDNALRLTPLVNSWITMHSVLMRPQSNEVEMSWDNGYAASMPRQALQMSEVF